MRHVVIPIGTFEQLRQDLAQWRIEYPSGKTRSVLAQIYAVKKSQQWMNDVSVLIGEYIDDVSVVGCLGMGTIYSGGTLDSDGLLSLFMFEHSEFHVLSCEMERGDESHVGNRLWQQIITDYSDIKGVLCLVSASSIDTESLLNSVSDPLNSIPVFGALAGDKLERLSTLLFCEGHVVSYGAILVVFSGARLRIKTSNYLGWVPFGEEFVVTETYDYDLISINNHPAFPFYQYYTGIDRDNFFDNSIEFPFIIYRNDIRMARVPIWVKDEKLQFLAGFKNGDHIQFGYGDVNAIFDNLSYSCSHLQRFKPEAILIYSCCSRMFFLKEDSTQVMTYFDGIAPVAGFFSLGEIDTANSGSNVLNATMLTIALSEEDSIQELEACEHKQEKGSITPENCSDLLRLNRLMRFVTRMTEKLYETNRKLQQLAEYDELTGIFNRRILSKRLTEEMAVACKFHSALSIILFDIDYFKTVNDSYGHLIGDEVLQQLSAVVQKELRKNEIFARYGGEEFVVVLPNVELGDALDIAERLRAKVEQYFIEQHSPTTPLVTASFGVASLSEEETLLEQFLHRADEALYLAKSNGRNRVEFSL